MKDVQCRHCGIRFTNCSEEMVWNHIVKCAKEKQQQMHPEVLDLDEPEENRDIEQENIIHPLDEEC